MDKNQIVKKANEIRKRLTGDFTQVKDLIDQHELVFAVWNDATSKDAETLIVKGQRLLMNIATGAEASSVSWTAIPCVDAEQAQAVREVAEEAELD